MKTIAAVIIIIGVILGQNAFAAETRLTKEAVIAIGAIILEDKSTREFHGGFSLEDPQFDQEKRIWRFQLTDGWSPSFPSSPFYFFEIRDKDSYYRIGSISGSGYEPKSSARFRMLPSMRRKINAVSGR